MSEFFFIFNFADTSKWRYRATGLNAVADVVEDAHLVESTSFKLTKNTPCSMSYIRTRNSRTLFAMGPVFMEVSGALFLSHLIETLPIVISISLPLS